MKKVTDSDTTNRRPSVGIIIVNYNAGGFLTDCVTRIVSQVDSIVVVDNDSQDDSVAKLERALSPNENVKIIKQNANLGFSAACNVGIDHASDDFLLFLNPDCLLEHAAVETLVRSFDSAS
jgi:GT2 family glycosyltransferase